MVGSGRVPGMEAGRGCRCLFRRCSSEDSEPGTGLRRVGGGRETKPRGHQDGIKTRTSPLHTRPQRPKLTSKHARTDKIVHAAVQNVYERGGAHGNTAEPEGSCSSMDVSCFISSNGSLIGELVN